MDAFVTRKRRRSPEMQDSIALTLRQESSISPPPKRNASSEKTRATGAIVDLTRDEDCVSVKESNSADNPKQNVPVEAPEGPIKTISSPIQLNHVRDLPVKSNIDTLKLSDILGDPMIQECWLFNYLFDIDFVMCEPL